MKNSDQPAFPDPLRGGETNFQNQTPDNLPSGLTKREYFAAKAMQGLLVNYVANDQYGSHTDYPMVHQIAVRVADALLAELETPTKPNYATEMFVMLKHISNAMHPLLPESTISKIDALIEKIESSNLQNQQQ